MTTSGTRVFFAYPGSPALRAETLRTAAGRLASRLGVEGQPWEDLQVGGRVMIREIEHAIDDSAVVAAEIGSLNQNVLYEVGYAIARRKRLWLLLDETDEVAQKNWKTFGLLSSIGYHNYEGASDAILSGYSVARPDLDQRELLWDELLRDFRSGVDPRTLFLFPTSLRGDAPRQLDRELTKRKNLAVLRADEDERGYAPLSYYAEMIHRSSAALVYMLGQQRVRSAVHNARASLIAGLAAGLGRPLLMLAEESFDPPIDYQDTLYKFHSVRDLTSKLNSWLDDLPTQTVRSPARLREALGFPLNLGEYVAEYEAEQLEHYFVPTAEYSRVLNNQSGTAIFVGRKGTGKTATMLQAAGELGRDKRNLVTVIKPSGYDLESLLSVLDMLPNRGDADYFLNGLWEYLLHCEIAAAAVREAEGKPAGIASGSSMDSLRAYLDECGVGLEQDLAVRLEGVVSELLTALPDMPSGVASLQSFLNQKLHASILRDMRRMTGEALGSRQRVALLIDNLDKAWERGADYERLSRVIFGLLSAVGHVARDFSRDNAWRTKVNVTLTVFLRADIFSMILRHAREPDKIDVLQIRWKDPQLLSRVIEDRYSSLTDTSGEALWTNIFAEQIRGMNARQYVMWRVLPRPRDLVYLCNASLLEATNSNHDSVYEADVISGEREYSQFAFEALLVESDPEAGLGELLFDFAGRPATLTRDHLGIILNEAARPDFDKLLGTLLRSSFLGLEVADDVYEYFSDETSERKHRALARHLSEVRKMPARYRIHPAFRPFLEIQDDDLDRAGDPLPLGA